MFILELEVREDSPVAFQGLACDRRGNLTGLVRVLGNVIMWTLPIASQALVMQDDCGNYIELSPLGKGRYMRRLLKVRRIYYGGSWFNRPKSYRIVA